MKQYVQHSKKLTVWAFIQWIVVVLCMLIVMTFFELAPEEIDIMSSIVTWSATQAGIVISTYMGNSSIEKYAAKKFSLQSSVEKDKDDSCLDGFGSNG